MFVKSYKVKIIVISISIDRDTVYLGLYICDVLEGKSDYNNLR